MDTSKPLHPILKWAGGKRQLLDEIIPMTPPHQSIEPMLSLSLVAEPSFCNCGRSML